MTASAETKSSALQARVDALARAAEQSQRAATYRLMLAGSRNLHQESRWAMLIVGGSLALLVPNLKDLLDIYPVHTLQIALALLLASGVVGLFAKWTYAVIERSLRKPTDYVSELGNCLQDYHDKLQNLLTR